MDREAGAWPGRARKRLVLRADGGIGRLPLELASKLALCPGPVLLGRAPLGPLGDLVGALADHLRDHAAAVGVELAHPDKEISAPRRRQTVLRRLAMEAHLFAPLAGEEMDPVDEPHP